MTDNFTPHNIEVEYSAGGVAWVIYEPGSSEPIYLVEWDCEDGLISCAIKDPEQRENIERTMRLKWEEQRGMLGDSDG